MKHSLKKILLFAFSILLSFAMPVFFTGCSSEKLPQITDSLVSNEPAETTIQESPVLALRNISSIKITSEEPDPDGGELLGVGFAADGNYIIVSFKAPVDLADKWIEGSIFIVDEKTDTNYWDIPTVPVLGLLLGKPKEKGQMGYAMLKNNPNKLEKGDLVTVILGNYKREHVKIK
jgi:hypothetical protein